MALLNARSADTANATRAHTAQTKFFRTRQEAKLKNRPGTGRETITEHMRGAIPSSETDSEFLNRSKQKMEIPSSLAGDMPLLLYRARKNPGERRITAKKKKVTRRRQPSGSNREESRVVRFTWSASFSRVFMAARWKKTNQPHSACT